MRGLTLRALARVVRLNRNQLARIRISERYTSTIAIVS